MNEQEALEYAKKTTICVTCEFFHDRYNPMWPGGYCNKILLMNPATSEPENLFVEDVLKFGCIYWEKKNVALTEVP